ncbi:hypothetical protein [Janthinobacterium sp. PC23-8]|uniref:hypothetical protein n=1 Tax=Janthinobacterium sp. PC23-8 TaxID=2012679 RepID=UPI000B96D3E3|nr:hypothetical protein [Janthinobacterium sp. PC23-8]OYO25903.1 hypothetical protein CD932_27910 [Janthinobacterium sp. PC23-8]
MNALKNMEIAFVAAAVLAIGSSFATADSRAVSVSADSAVVAQALNTSIPVVAVSARRLSAAEKAAFI